MCGITLYALIHIIKVENGKVLKSANTTSFQEKRFGHFQGQQMYMSQFAHVASHAICNCGEKKRYSITITNVKPSTR